ncbi:MAG: RNA-binding protein [Chloroflexaceae bacterium]|nr:RNA-binding protein [Chloroflexaceae bacterium]
MLVKLFVGNLPWSVGDTQLGDLFSPHGTVQSARVITDRETGRSRGFGFVELETNDIKMVISATDGLEVQGRPLRVNEAEEKNAGGGGNRGRPPRSGSRGRF